MQEKVDEYGLMSVKPSKRRAIKIGDTYIVFKSSGKLAIFAKKSQLIEFIKIPAMKPTTEESASLDPQPVRRLVRKEPL